MEAEELQRRALGIQEAAFGPDHYFVALSLYNLGLLLRQAGRPAQAAPLLR